MSIQPRVELEVAHWSKFLLERSRAEPESAQSPRVWSVDGTTCRSRTTFPLQIVFNADRAVLESDL